jgi:phage terminase large subunit-like protein
MTNSPTSLSAFDYSKLDDLEQIVLTEAQRRRDTNRIADVYPDEGPLWRELYAKHIAFFKAGATHMERAAIVANRVGKTWGIGGYETTVHLTGDYPPWWEGRRFDRPVDVWAAGDTSETTRDIVQLALMGPINAIGTGLIPAAKILGEPARRSGTANSIDTVLIQHKSGGTSYLGFKSYDQGRRKFQGTGKHVIWLDEEPPADVYDECLLRLMTTKGIMICTFTPLLGLSDVAMRFLPELAPAET